MSQGTRDEVEAAKKRVLELKRKLQTVNDSLAKVDAARERFNTEYENCYGLKCTQLERFQISGSFLPRDYDLTSTDSLIPLYDGPLKNELIRHFVTAVDKQLSNHPRNKGVLNKPKCQRPIYKVVNVYKANPPAALVQQFNAYCSARSATLAQDIVPYVMNHPRKCGKGQFLLYHGCDWNVVDEIIQGGFRKEMSAMNRKCLFGKKLYFADLSSKSGCYVRSNTGSNQGVGVFRMIVARVYLGKPFFTKKAMYDDTDDPAGYDSVAAITKDQGHGCVHYPEFMLGNNIGAMPEYVIEFEHEPTCRCSQCELRY